MSNTVDGTSKIKNGTQGISDALTYAAGYAYARDIDERGESKKGPYRGDNIPEPILVGLRYWPAGMSRIRRFIGMDTVDTGTNEASPNMAGKSCRVCARPFPAWDQTGT